MIDVQAIIDQIKKLFTDTFAEKWPEVKEVALGYLASTEQRLIDLKTNLQLENITPAFAAERIKEEPTILKSELTSLLVILESNGEVLVNAIMGIFDDTLNLLIPQQEQGNQPGAVQG